MATKSTARGDEIRRQIAEGKLEPHQPVTAVQLAHIMDVAEGNAHGLGVIQQRASDGCSESFSRLEQLAPDRAAALKGDDAPAPAATAKKATAKKTARR